MYLVHYALHFGTHRNAVYLEVSTMCALQSCTKVQVDVQNLSVYVLVIR